MTEGYSIDARVRVLLYFRTLVVSHRFLFVFTIIYLARQHFRELSVMGKKQKKGKKVQKGNEAKKKGENLEEGSAVIRHEIQLSKDHLEKLDEFLQEKPTDQGGASASSGNFYSFTID